MHGNYFHEKQLVHFFLLFLYQNAQIKYLYTEKLKQIILFLEQQVQESKKNLQFLKLEYSLLLLQGPSKRKDQHSQIILRKLIILKIIEKPL